MALAYDAVIATVVNNLEWEIMVILIYWFFK